MHLLDPQVYLQALRGHAQGLAGSPTGPSPLADYIDFSAGEWATSDPGFPVRS